MSADTTVASDPAGIFAGSADGANRCYQTLPSTERCALAALRACDPTPPPTAWPEPPMKPSKP
jgi:hypothetical protein